MLVYGFGVSQYPKFMIKIYICIKFYHVCIWGLLRVSLETSLLKKWSLDLADQAEKIVWEYIETRTTSGIIDKKIADKYYSNLKEKLDKAKEIPPSAWMIEEIIFTFMDVIRGKLFINNPRNLNHVHKASKDFLFVIINMGKI